MAARAVSLAAAAMGQAHSRVRVTGRHTKQAEVKQHALDRLAAAESRGIYSNIYE